MSAGAAPEPLPVPPLPDRDASLTQLWTLFDGAPDDHWVSIVGITRGGTVAARWAKADNLENAADIAHRLNAAGQNVYVGMATVDTPTRQAIDKRKGRVTTAEAGAVGGAWVEIDLAGQHRSDLTLPPDEATALALVRATGLPEPTLILHSGGGLHLYFAFAEPYLIETPAERAMLAALVAGVQAAIRRSFATYDYHLDGTADLARVLRLAGTINYNGDVPRLARLVAQDGPRVTTADLEPFAATVDARPPAEAAPITEGARLTQTERAELVPLFQPAYLVGQRRQLALYGAGWLAKNGVPEADARLIFQTVAMLAADDSDLPTIAAVVASTYKDAREGKPVAGWSKLTDQAAPLVKPETAAGLDAFNRRRHGSVVGITQAPSAGQAVAQGDVSSCPALLAAAVAETDTLRAEVARLTAAGDRTRRAYDLMRERARRLQRRTGSLTRELGQQRHMANHRAYRGRADIVEAVVERLATARPEPDGSVRLFKEDLVTRLGRGKGTKIVNDTLAPAIACGAVVERVVETRDADGLPRTRCYLDVPGLTRTGDASADRARIRARFLTAPDEKRTGEKGQGHGGSRPGAGRKHFCTDCNTLVDIVAERKAVAHVLSCGHITYELAPGTEASADHRAPLIHSVWESYQGKALRLPDGTTGTLLLMAADLETGQAAGYLRVAGEKALRRLTLDELDGCTAGDAPVIQVELHVTTEGPEFNLNCSDAPTCAHAGCGRPAEYEGGDGLMRCQAHAVYAPGGLMKKRANPDITHQSGDLAAAGGD